MQYAANAWRLENLDHRPETKSSIQTRTKVGLVGLNLLDAPNTQIRKDGVSECIEVATLTRCHCHVVRLENSVSLPNRIDVQVLPTAA